MEHQMFCFQCEQTAGCTGCTGRSGVCGKTAPIARLQDQLTGALIGLARTTDGNQPTEDTWRLLAEGLFTTVTNVNFNEKTIGEMIDRVHAEKERLAPGCASCADPCGRTGDYEMEELWNAQEDIRSLKSLILFGVRGMAAYAHHAMVLGYQDDEVNRFFAKALFAVGEDWTMEELLPIVMEVGEKNYRCMELLDRANTETYGDPVPTTVPLTVEKGPFIVISGHDLHDLKLLLEQTQGKGVNIYTHGEMLPAHGYPELKRYPHLKGNFGTAWQNQQKEFQNLPAPILFTTNCLMPPRESYRDRVFTTTLVWKDVRTCIAKSKGRFISIMSLIALGSFALVGLQVAGPDMRKTGEDYFNDLHAADLTVIGDYGLDEDDQAAINQAGGTEEIEYGYLKDVVIQDTLSSVRIFSETGALSSYELVEGTMPKAENEIALASLFGDDYPVGSQITVSEKAGITGTDTLKEHTFTVVGLVNSSELLSKINMGQSTAGTGELTGYGVVVPEAFDSEVYMLARLSYTDLEGLDPYSEEYTEKLQAHKEELSDLLAYRPALRLEAVRVEYQDKIDQGQQEIDDAKAQLSDAEAQLLDGQTQLEDAKSQVADAQTELDDGTAQAQSEIEDGESQLQEAAAEIEDGQAQLDTAAAAIAQGESQLSAAQSQLAQKQKELDVAKAQLQAGQAEYQQNKSLLAEKQQEYDDNAAVLAEKQQELTAAQAELDAAQSELTQKQQELENGKAQYEAGIAALQQSVDALQGLAAAGSITPEQEAQLTQLTAQLSQTQQAYQTFLSETYTPGCAQISAAQAQLNQQQAQVDAAKAQLEEGETQLAAAKAQLEDGYAQLAQAKSQLDAAQAQVSAGEAQLSAAANTIAQNQQTLTEKKAEYAQGVSTLEAAKQTYAEKSGELEDAKATLEQESADGRTQIADAQTEIAEKEQELADAQAEYDDQAPDARQEIADGEAELEDARQAMEALSLPSYNIDSRREIPGGEGYRIYSSVSNIVDALADVFPIFLYFVAALVALTTMTRFVDEERMNSGTLKALGYSNRDIQKKFVFYGLTASLAGAVIGIAAGHTLIPMIVYNAYGKSFTYPEIELHFYPGITAIALVLALVSAVLPAYLVSEKELREKPASLLLPKAPAAGAKILLERITPIWNHMNFTHKVTARNIFRYKKRMLMTIFGVCGAVTLLFAGFSVQHSISGINDRQFGEILQYDLIVAENNSLTDAQREELNTQLSSEEVVQELPIYYEEVTRGAGDNQDKQTIKLIVPSDSQALQDYILLDQRSTGEKINLDDSGAVISERLAKLLDAKAGDDVTITDSKGTEHTIRIAAVTEMYTGHFLFLSSDYYQTAFGEAFSSNAHLVTLHDRSTDNANAVASEFMELDGVAGVVQNTTLIGQINTIVASLNKIMDVLIVVAVLLAVVILYNLTNINVSERIRELSTIRVLGFYDKEVTLYIYRETILLTILGILAGFGLGDVLYRYIIAVVPPDDVMFNPALGCKAFLVPTLVVCVITAILGWVIHRRLQKVDMLGALKSVE